MFNDIVESDRYPLLSEGDEKRGYTPAACADPPLLKEKKRFRQRAGSRMKSRPQEFVYKEKREQT
jgi:hypothetical protein